MELATQRLIDVLAHPADDPKATLLLMLASVALGLLIAVILMAVASPRRGSFDNPESDDPVDDTE
ncbi:MAG: hypothetical protein Q7U89_05540 [Coriobacteriia bacterium]|nr:hypothetical protein [Coriobacteriia bacterium]